MNFFSLGEISVVMDLAHNEAGLEAMVEIMNGVRRPGARILLGLGAVGDRQDDLLERLGEIAGMNADVVAIGHKQRYLRGRSQEEMDDLFRAGLERVGMTDVASYDTEVESLAALVGQARPGDVVGPDVPRRAAGGLRLDRRARRYARRPRRPWPPRSGPRRHRRRGPRTSARLTVVTELLDLSADLPWSALADGEVLIEEGAAPG